MRVQAHVVEPVLAHNVLAPHTRTCLHSKFSDAPSYLLTLRCQCAVNVGAGIGCTGVLECKKGSLLLLG